ncbi:hypothetical protein NM688_g2125 [Phlebia brevispora]|uniref:Uncharacterized protein n=1 Tax=Phlebia brevispora TaxID=194682 RepID=A0ACC1T9V0_9APHY|nr:hypothetical protein NM688_g2125 [Phlebia brevispora]
MVHLALCAVGLFLGSAIASSVVQRRDIAALANLLVARQLSIPNIPSSSDSACPQCTTAANDVQCGDMSCICVDSHLQDMADCYTCITPYLNSDPNWTQEAQQALSSIVQGCDALGLSVTPPKFEGSTVPSTIALDDGPTETDSCPFPHR